MINNKNAINHLKKLNLKGERSVDEASLPVKKLPDQNKDEATKRMKAK